MHELNERRFDNITALLEDDSNNVVILTGDLNGLSMTYLQTQFELHQFVIVPTYNNNILDVLLTNLLDLFQVQVGQSLIMIKHKALIINAKSLNDKSVQGGSCRKVKVWYCNLSVC